MIAKIILNTALSLCPILTYAQSYPAHSQTNSTIVRFYPNGQKQINGSFKNSLPDGTWTRWFENGKKSEEIIYKDGQIIGTGKMWYPNGQRKSERHLKNNE